MTRRRLLEIAKALECPDRDQQVAENSALGPEARALLRLFESTDAATFPRVAAAERSKPV